MKQQITREQLEGLSEHALRKYADYAVVKECYITNPIKNMPNEDGTFTEMVEPARLHLMTIGMMIEFLYEKNAMELEGMMNTEGYDYDWNKLCDDLWDAVKEVLEK